MRSKIWEIDLKKLKPIILHKLLSSGPYRVFGQEYQTYCSGLKTVQSANNDETKEQCELCGQKVPHPVTYHMSKHHPGCKSNCGK